MTDTIETAPGDAPVAVDPCVGGPVSVGVRALDAGAVLEQLVAERAAAERAEARVLELAVHYVDLHPPTESSLLDDPEVRLAGEGTPGIASSAVEELGAVLGVPFGAAWQLVLDSVELCHRLPRLWRLVHAGVLPAWRARSLARLTSTLPREAVGFVDRQAAIAAARRRFPGLPKLRDLVHEARLRVDPDFEQAVEELALGHRGVWFDHQTSTTSTATSALSATLDAWDALDLDAAIGDLAGTLGRLGDTTPVDVRRATALALLAHPQRVLDLDPTTEPDTTVPTGPDAGVAIGEVAAGEVAVGGVRPAVTSKTRRRGRTIELVVHVNLADLAHLAKTGLAHPSPPPGPASGYGIVEGLGPALASILAGWCRRADQIVVRPVLHLGAAPGAASGDPQTTATRPVDRHDPPEAMRELVILRDGQCVFPGCRIDARSCDLDHVTAYLDPDDGGPPGQTHPGNLACLCRRHHRLKTFTGWTYQPRPDGTYHWTSPRGHHFLTHPSPIRGPAR